jgi:hypothetical protein
LAVVHFQPTINGLVNYSIALNDMGGHTEAADLSKQAWDRARRIFGDEHTLTRSARASHADAMQALGHPTEAVPATQP